MKWKMSFLSLKTKTHITMFAKWYIQSTYSFIFMELNSKLVI